MDLLVSLEGISPSEVLATGRTFVLLVGRVDTFVPFEMLALRGEGSLARGWPSSMLPAPKGGQDTYSAKGLAAEAALQAFGGRLVSHRKACCEEQTELGWPSRWEAAATCQGL